MQISGKFQSTRYSGLSHYFCSFTVNSNKSIYLRAVGKLRDHYYRLWKTNRVGCGSDDRS